jgi:hypothetical protein
MLLGSTLKHGPIGEHSVVAFTGVSDDECDTAGEMWYDSNDGAFEYCNAASGVPAVLGSNPGIDTTLTFTIDSDNTAGSEPADGAGFEIEGGGGLAGFNISMFYNTTDNTLDFSGAPSGYVFDAPISSPAVISTKTDATYTIGTDDADEAYGSIFLNGDNDAIAFTLPPAVAGMSVSIQNDAGVSGAITIDTEVGDGDAIILNGVAGANGETIVSGGTSKDSITLVAISASEWLVTYSDGTWNESTPAALHDDCSQIVSGFLNPTEAGATDDFLNLVDNTRGAADADEDEFVVPVAMVAHSLKVSDVTDPGGAGDTWDITVMDDGVATALTCTVANTETACSDVANTPTIAADSDMTVLVDSGNGASDPDASANMRISFCLRPS